MIVEPRILSATQTKDRGGEGNCWPCPEVIMSKGIQYRISKQDVRKKLMKVTGVEVFLSGKTESFKIQTSP